MNRTPLFVLAAVLTLIIAGCSKPSAGGGDADATRNILIQQLKTTHNQKEWFVPVNQALEGLTAEQAMWRDSSGNHSIGQLAYHLLFWNKQQLAKFAGQPQDKFSGNNEDTFTQFDQTRWNQTVSSLDSVLTACEKVIETANEAQLKEWAPIIANMSTHNAYHTGQVLYIRKLQHSWDPEKGVK